MSEQNEAPSLQSILATLASFSNPPPTTANTRQPTSFAPQPNPPHNSQDQTPKIPQSHTPSSLPKPPPSQVIDPARITSWRQAKHCITKLSQSNPDFHPTISRLRTEQRNHEVHWYGKRQALKLKQSTRATESKRALSILSALSSSAGAGPGGGSIGTSGSTNPPGPATSNDTLDPEREKQKELEAFDREIYEQQVKLSIEQEGRLRALGVPFFGTDGTLIVADEVALAQRAKTKEAEEGEEWCRPITVARLKKLQTDMVGLLEGIGK